MKAGAAPACMELPFSWRRGIVNRTNEQSVVTHSKATHSAGRDGMKYQVITGERPLWLKFSPASKFEFAFWGDTSSFIDGLLF